MYLHNFLSTIALKYQKKGNIRKDREVEVYRKLFENGNFSRSEFRTRAKKMKFPVIISTRYFAASLKQIFLSNSGFRRVAVADISCPTSHLYVSQRTRYVLYKSRREVVSFWEFTEGMEVRDGRVAERNRRKRNCVAYSSLHFVFSMYTGGGL